ncbi:sensor histidine kinase [Parasphingopyxis lamellibrachiae]|uniref:histidine kinase n=1 Tax=Parasphingopyxis lamellibrachiae TaxID=680125 RepID=A0A3D9FGA8_9SPHN|nr:histidine kinase [Parasphingopyxis lamellibrachiae]RED16845.1 histidine kinase [Parasphingopyxis lamellibrachiae]
MDAKPFESTRSTLIGHRLGLVSITGLWGFYFAVVTIRAAILGYPGQSDMLIYRVVVTALAIGLTFLLYLFLERFADRPLRWRIPIAFAAALPIAAAIGAFNLYIFEISDPLQLFAGEEWKEERELFAEFRALDPYAMWRGFAEQVMSRYFVVIAWTLLYMALGYAQIVRQAERRAAIFAQEAQTAQLRALRYQVNPHFLFNTLNVLSSLVMRDRRDEAEQMILNLSTFYRTSLTAEPADDVSLEEEIRLQRLYLDIEAVRFPERLIVDIEVPKSLNGCCVPALILQPVVENAIKYGVSRVRRPVKVAIHAREENGKLIITVADDGDPLPDDAPHGTGVGLNNVYERLDARYGEDSNVTWGPSPGGGFLVTLELPINRESC